MRQCSPLELITQSLDKACTLFSHEYPRATVYSCRVKFNECIFFNILSCFRTDVTSTWSWTMLLPKRRLGWLSMTKRTVMLSKTWSFQLVSALHLFFSNNIILTYFSFLVLFSNLSPSSHVPPAIRPHTNFFPSLAMMTSIWLSS